MNDEEEFDAVQCCECENWLDEHYAFTCGGCDESVCPPCAATHVCRD